MELDMSLVAKCIAEYRTNKGSFETYQRYFKGDHDINRDYKVQDDNNQTVVKNYPRRFIKEEVSYVLANPVNYISKTGNKEAVSLIDLNFGVWETTHNQQLLEEALKFNEAYELCYTTKDNEFRCTVLTPLNSYVLVDDTIEKNVILVLQFYSKKFEDDEYVDIYFGDKKYTFNITNEDDYKQINEPQTINFDTAPVNTLIINNDGQSAIEDYKKLNDGYNNVLSDLINEVHALRNSILFFKGTKITAEQLIDLIKKGALLLPEKGEAGWVAKQINDEFVQNLLNTLNEDIHFMASHVDENEKLVSNVSSPTLRARLISLEHKCSTIANKMELLVKNRLKKFFQYHFKLTGIAYDYRDISVKFTPNVPQDLSGIADSASKLNGIVSKRTMRSWIPGVENPDLEEKYVNEEVGVDMSPDDMKKLMNDTLKSTTSQE